MDFQTLYMNAQHELARTKRQLSRLEQQQAGEPDPMLGVFQVAEMLGVSHMSVRRWSQAGQMPAPYRFGRTLYRWRRSDIQAWLETRKLQPNHNQESEQ